MTTSSRRQILNLFSAPEWKLAFRNLMRNRRRTTATGIAMTFGFTAMILLGGYIVRAAYGLGAVTVYLNMKGHIAVRKAGSLDGFQNHPKNFILTPKDVATIDSSLTSLHDEVEQTARFLTGSALLTDGKKSAPVLISGVEPRKYNQLINHPVLRKWAGDWVKDDTHSESMNSNTRLVSMTARLGEFLGRKAPFAALPPDQKEAQLLAKTYEHDLGAVDVELGPSHSTGMAFLDSTSLVTSLPLLQELLATDGIEYYAVYLKSTSHLDAIAKELIKKLGPNFEVFTYRDDKWSQFYVGQMNFLYVMAGFFSLLILGTVSLAIVNTTTLNLLERAQEIGTMRAIGYTPSSIRATFAREVALLGVICIVIGTGLSIVLSEIVNSINIRFSPPGAQGSVQFKLAVEPSVTLEISVLVLIVTIGSTYIVSRKKSREKIVRLLGETGA
jgi:putative ABC transport system permease protein